MEARASGEADHAFFRFPLSAFRFSPRQSRRGIALIVTLILLSITLVMAVAFLAIARRERNSVTTTTDTATARLATDTALAAASAQIAANILATNNGAYLYNLLVSTNFSTVGGITPGAATLNNISYFDLTGNLMAGNNLVEVVTNLYLLPRAPVFVYNRNTGSNDFRFYLDLNRNGQFETNNPFTGTAGDPEWVGVLERPDQPHSANNKFVARYAFLAQPIGNSLDLNAIHNQVFNPSSTLLASLGASDGYFRNEGVGSWELNLAAFLADLNTNQWDNTIAPYNYLRPGNIANNGNAFYDAGSLLAWRYADNFNNLATPGLSMLNALAKGAVDGYTLGPLMTTTFLPIPNSNIKAVGPWDGSDNTNRFFALPTDLFDPAKSAYGLNTFTNHLVLASASTNNYDRYTFYRLLDQLGTDSTADDSRMNLNYSNALVSYNASGVVTNITIYPGAETNAQPWLPLDFFTTAADRMLRHYTTNWINANYAFYTNTFGTNITSAFSVTNIPVYINGQFVYSPAVNRILQLAANLYDASVTNFYPSVFRPTFWVTNENTFKNVYINGYTYVNKVQDENDPNYFNTPEDAETLALALPGSKQTTINVYGVPWIIGAKKGLPSFNQFFMLSGVQVTRKLQVTRPITAANPTPPIRSFYTNQLYQFSITNSLGCSLWNSYVSNYVGNLTIAASDTITMVLTNDAPGFAPIGYANLPIASVVIKTNSWPGTSWGGTGSATVLNNVNSFIVPFNGPFAFMTNAIYRYGGYSGPNPYFDASPGWQTNVYTPALPHFGLQTTNRLRVFILDGATAGNYHVLDYVHFAGPNSSTDINAELADPYDPTNLKYYLWNTNPATANVNGTPYGVINQINYSAGNPGPANAKPNFWQAPPQYPSYLPKTQPAEQAFFASVYNVTASTYGRYVYNGKAYTNTLLTVQAPYTPTRMIYTNISWQVNDPLVHYLASDLTYLDASFVDNPPSDDPAGTLSTILGINGPDNLNNITKRYSPWNKAYNFGNSISGGATQMQLKDPGIWRSDDWNFPTNKYPAIGWLGRVHRGTPWQTVYLKASDVLTNATDAIAQGLNGSSTWAKWTGNTQLATNQSGQIAYFDSANSAPVQDRDLFSLFTATPNANATRGTLSVNQMNLAAWSALFSGLAVPNNLAGGYVVIPPAGPAGWAGDPTSYLGPLVTNINYARATFTNADGVVGAFEQVGDILRTPQLSEASPFLAGLNGITQTSDALYEWLPQQTLGLLRANSTPRYVIYCYGQTLRPAVNGLVTSSAGFGLVTNYQVTAESAARAVIRVDKHISATGTNYSTVIESFNPLPSN